MPALRPSQQRRSCGLQVLRRIAILLALAPCRPVDPALAVQSVRVSPDSDAIDLTRAVERYSAQGDRIQVSTAPGADGIVRRIEVSALEAGAQPSWIVFALTNNSDEQLTRLIVAPHFRFVGSGVVWPDLGSSRITTITASQGAAPERDDNTGADVFRLTLDPGTTVTYVAELRTPSLPQLYLWEPDAFKDKSTSLTLYEGILIGNRWSSRVLSHDRVRRAGRDDLSCRRGARVGGVRLCVHRLRLLAKNVRPGRRVRANLARRRRGKHRRHAHRIPVRLPQSAPLARAIHAFRFGLAGADGRLSSVSRSSTRRSRRAWRAFRLRLSPGLVSSLS